MNSTYEHNKSQTSMEDLKAMQTKAAFARNMEKAGNVQKAVTLTEENWTGLTNAVEQTGQSVLQLQESVAHLLTDEQMDEKLKAQVQMLMLKHSESISGMQTAVRELNESSVVHWNRIVEFTEDSLRATKQAQETALKEFGKQVGRASENYSSELSRATDSVKESVKRIKWQMYLPTIVLVLWELVRHLFLLD